MMSDYIYSDGLIFCKHIIIWEFFLSLYSNSLFLQWFLIKKLTDYLIISENEIPVLLAMSWICVICLSKLIWKISSHKK